MELVKLALDEVTFVDTAVVCRTEEIVGAAVRDRREGVVISTKVPISPHRALTSEMIGPDALEAEVDDCPKRLGTDWADVLHRYDHARTALLERMREGGNLRFTDPTERFAGVIAHQIVTRATEGGAFDVIMLGLQSTLRAVVPVAKRSGGDAARFVVRGPFYNRESAEALLWKLVRRPSARTTRWRF